MFACIQPSMWPLRVRRSPGSLDAVTIVLLILLVAGLAVGVGPQTSDTRETTPRISIHATDPAARAAIASDQPGS